MYIYESCTYCTFYSFSYKTEDIVTEENQIYFKKKGVDVGVMSRLNIRV